jgi:hypothetical protein
MKNREGHPNLAVLWSVSVALRELNDITTPREITIMPKKVGK